MTSTHFDHHSLGYFLFPLAAALKTGEAIASGVELRNADNKNLGKVLHTAALTQEASLITTGVILSELVNSHHVHAFSAHAAKAVGAAVPWLFVAAIAGVTLYQGLQLVRAIHHYFQAPKNSTLRKVYCRKITNHAIGFIAGAALTVTVVMLFGLVVSNPIGFAALGMAAAIGALIINKGITRRRNKRDKAQAQAEEKQALAENTAQATNYEYVENYSARINNGKSTPDSKMMGGFIQQKINQLKSQKEAAEKTPTWRTRLFSQTAKRQAKIKALKSLKTKLEDDQVKGEDISKEIKTLSMQYKRAGIFQSFYRQTGEVEHIFRTVERNFGATASAA